MTAPRVELAESYAAELTGKGVPTFADPAAAAANLPAVLLAPPELTFDRLGVGAESVSWRLVVLAEGPAGLESWRQLDGLLELLAAEVGLRDARPGAYTLTAGADPLPAYICTADE